MLIGYTINLTDTIKEKLHEEVANKINDRPFFNFLYPRLELRKKEKFIVPRTKNKHVIKNIINSQTENSPNKK